MGQVTQFVRYRENPICQIGDGGHFGEIALLRADQRRTANVVTLAFSELQVQTLCTLCEEDPTFTISLFVSSADC